MCGWAPLSGIVLFPFGALNMAIGFGLARVNLSQNMSFAAAGKERCFLACFCQTPGTREVFAGCVV
jgi:hypothetical protein